MFVLQVGRIEEPLTLPRGAVDTARVAFEVSRRHRFFRESTLLPEGVTLHVLPSGGALEGDDRLLAYRRMDTVSRRIERAYQATREYLAGLQVGGG